VLEAVVERGLQTFVAVGNALREIRDLRLYRESHGSFEDYCRERWQFSRQRAGQLIEAAAVSTMVDVPNERQARELAPLLRDDEAEVVDAWRELRDEYGAENVTAKKIRGIVRRRLARKRRDGKRAAERALQGRAAVRAALGGEVEWRVEIQRRSPREELLGDCGRIGAQLDKLRAARLQQEREWFGRSFDVAADWMPYVSIGDALRGKRRSTPGRELAAETLQEVERYLFEQADVADALREIDAAFQAERDRFVSDLSEWIAERSQLTGRTVEPLLDRLRDLAESLPETPMQYGTSSTLVAAARLEGEA
jgi:hypothetical protein